MAPLSAIVLAAFAVEATLGFGATLITVSFGVFLLPIPELLPIFVPANLVLSCAMIARHHREVDRGLLLRGILPLMALGLPVGIVLARAADAHTLETAFGVVVVALALPELVRAVRAAAETPRAPLPPAVRGLALVIAGVVHGAFATGGPLVVWVADRAALDKGRFRATLVAVWAVFGVVLTATFAAYGQLSPATATGSAVLLVPVLLGVVAGEWLHARVPAPTFRKAVLLLLCVAGAAIALR
jgi:uncharacterized membrane protein YfcA